MKTTTVPAPVAQWHLVDAEGQSLGRLASKVAHILRGKHRPTFSPHQLCGDHIVIINAQKLELNQRALTQKEYRSHSGYIGHLKAVKLKDLFAKQPERVIEQAVKGMLPKNRLRASMLKRLHVFGGSEHEHSAQKPVPLSLTQ